MKLQDIVNADENGLVAIIDNIGISDRQRRYKLRKTVDAIRGELKIAYDERARIVKAIEPETLSISPAHPRYREALKAISDAWQAESSLKIAACIEETELDGIALSPAQDRTLETLGLKVIAKPEAKPQRRERMHVPQKKSGKKR